MRPTEFTAAEIIKAGQELQAAGRNITGFALRQRVGGGSAPRLRQVWDEHLSGQSVTTLEQVAELPVEVAEQLGAVIAALIERITHLATELNDKAVKAAERRVGEVVKAAGAQCAAAERELTDASQTVDELESKLDCAQADKVLLHLKLDEAIALGQKQAVELAQLAERLNSAQKATKIAHEKHASDLAAGQRTLKAAQDEIAFLREKLSGADVAARETAQEHAKTQAHAAVQHQALAVDLAEIRAHQASTEAGHMACAKQLQQAQQEKVAAQDTAIKAKEVAARTQGHVQALEHQVSELISALGGRAKPDGSHSG